MTIALLLLFSLFTYIAWRHFSYGLFIFFFLLPVYLIRFSIGPLPTTALEVMFVILALLWLIKWKKTYPLRISHWLSLGIFLFLLGATISVFTGVDLRAAAGAWKAFYLEPILFFFILIASLKHEDTRRGILISLILSGFITALFAIFQHFTGAFVPHAFWENGESFRVTAWYGFPNGVGLFLAPLVIVALYLLIEHIQETRRIFSIPMLIYALFILLGPLAIVFAKSTGSIVGAAAGIGILLLLYKKTRWGTIALSLVGLVLFISIPRLAPLREELTFGDRSGQIRVAIYQETISFLRDHPIRGAGLASYTERIEPYHKTVNGEGIEIFHHPHNLFLTIWVNLGLLGLLGFGIIIAWFVIDTTITFAHTQGDKKLFAAMLLGTMTVVLVTGLVDSPYIKNDLSIFFWLLLALAVSTKQEHM